jgi:arginyl-tRNA synthetase
MTESAVDAPAADARDPWARLLDALSEALAPALADAGVPTDPAGLRDQLDVSVRDQADVSLPLYRAAKATGQDPAALASRVAGSVGSVPGVARVAASAGYVNASVDPTWLTDATLGAVFRLGNQYGHGTGFAGTVCVEHTSANPTGPFHVGRVRNGIIGDTLARALRAGGSNVTTQYYVDDVGRQAAMITWIWSKPLAEWPPEIRATVEGAPEAPAEKPDRRLGRPYPAVSAYLKTHPEAAEEVAELNRALEAGTAPGRHRELAEGILRGMVESLARLGITFDEFVWESSFIRDGSVERVVERLGRGAHAVREPNGALALDATDFGLPKESARIIVTRGNGTSLYPTRDVAYHLAKFARFDRAVDVLGQDHQLHARTLDALLAEIGETRRPEYVIYQDITVPGEGGGRMSTRHGTAVWLDDLLGEAVRRAREEVLARREDLDPKDIDFIAEKVAAAAVRYHIVRVAPEKPVAFRWEDALSFEGRSAPFLMYSYARASSILRKAERTAPPYSYRAGDLLGAPERHLMKSISRLPSVVAYVGRTAHVHTLAAYAHDLAEEFNRFYQEVPVLRAGAERESRLALVAAARQGLGNTLELLGLERLETM